VKKAIYKFTDADRVRSAVTRKQKPKKEDDSETGDLSDWEAVYGWSAYDTGRRV
jgi:hypothetical protein